MKQSQNNIKTFSTTRTFHHQQPALKSQHTEMDTDMADNFQQIIAAQAREIETLKAARNVPNTAAADMADILNVSNTTLLTDKSALEARNAALVHEMTALVRRNNFMEAELGYASHMLKQTIPGEKGLKEQNRMLHVENDALKLQQKTLLEDNLSFYSVCKQWSDLSLRQCAEITALRENEEVQYRSLMRKARRLEVQKEYLDKAGLVVKEFEETKYDLAKKNGTELEQDKIEKAGGADVETAGAEQVRGKSA